jgi:hypothetical protein
MQVRGEFVVTEFSEKARPKLVHQAIAEAFRDIRQRRQPKTWSSIKRPVNSNLAAGSISTEAAPDAPAPS